ncbi:acetyl-CoA synthetase-like protein [Aspergillus saccharolyticus JOP 1030-1]|uniref:Acetyl-CoA synthetase-like protein n=1 Tax=Aspergillus saccharolyticus JOP 1030-1 TaxID=1450539 RepID=A0A318Z8K8_9EURO|nr:acetyl-CoA synthetase-like protein [Aspergillus saccharolyticus JOP 1030-1]PYH43509.1 acetyl-CoA synthetase-like protein [Aspergillus saccharolyticus JOP 1030-1]
MFPQPPTLESEETVASILSEAFESNSTGVAIDWEHEDQITYEQLHDKVQRLARRLRPQAPPGTPVVVCLPRSVAQIVSIATIQWLGAVYVPLDPTIPQSRLQGLLKRLQKPVILANQDFLQRYPNPQSIDGTYLNVEQCLADDEEHAVEQSSPIAIREPDDLAIILFTSGSTGEPKGVKLSNRNIIEPIRYLSCQQDITTRSRILQFAGPAFDVHMLDIFCGLFNAATLCLVTKDKLLSQLAFWINKMEASMIHLTPSMLSMLRPVDVPGIRYMLSSGEAITQEIIDTWASSAVLLNLYGPCEASSIVGSRLLPGDSASIIGKATPFSNIIALQEDGQPAGPGESGEIYCTGKTIFLGYLGDESMTRSKFRAQGPGLPDLFGTGDVGLVTEDGYLKLLGRIDTQVKINGQRVELQEIDHALTTIAAKAVTRWRKDPGGQIRLHSFATESSAFCYPSDPCELRTDGQKLIERLSGVCRATLPSYMVPEIILVSAIPLNASEKIDQKRLDLLLESHLQSASGILELDATAGNTATEQIVATMISEQLNRPVRSAQSNLLSMGLSSLDAMAVLKQIHFEFAVSLSLHNFLQGPTVKQVAKMIDEQAETRTADLSTQLPKEDISIPNEEAITSPSQDRIFAADRLLANSAYNCNFVLRLPSMDLDVERLRRAIFHVYARHDVLHSTYHDADSDGKEASPNALPLVRQRVWPVADLPLQWTVVGPKDWEIVGVQHKKSLLESCMDRIATEAEILFNLSQESALRVTVYELGSQQWIVHFNVHHIAMDEWSFHILTREIEEFYSSEQSFDAQSSPAAVQYHEFAKWQRSTSLQHEYNNHLQWWEKRIGDELASLRPEDLGPLPPHVPSLPVEERDKSQLITQDLDSDLFRSFQEQICAGSTAFVGWLALFQLLMARVSRKNEFLLAVPATERGVSARFIDVVGFCLNTVLIPSTVAPTDTFKTLLARTQETFLSCISHSVPYEDVVANLAAKRQTGRSSLQLSVMFVLHDLRTTPGKAFDASSFLETADYIQLPTKGADFPLIVHIDPNYSPPRLILQHRFDAFRASFVQTLGRGFASLLQDVVHSGLEAPLMQMNLISPRDARILDSWAVAPKIPEHIRRAWLEKDGLTLVDLFHEVVERYPGLLAVEGLTGEKFTYEQLYARSAMLSRFLTRRYDISGQVVVIAMDKSPALVITVLAVLLSGAAFLMIDPTHKSILNASKVSVSNASLMITDSESYSAVNQIPRPADTSILRFDETRWANEPATTIQSSIPVSSGAWFCFTSGSTGNPKCFSIPHRAAAACLMSLIDYFQHGPGTRMPLLSNVVFDVSISSMLSPLLSGGTLCLAPSESFVTDLETTLRALAITHMEATPSVVATLSGPCALPSLQSLSLGGEPPVRDVTKMWMDKVDVYNIYCPAECTIIGFIHRFKPSDDPEGMMRNIGRRTSPVRSMILDANKCPVLPGAVGYLHIGSYMDGKLGQLSTGYLAPQSANAKFSQDSRAGRIYNSGDLAYYDEEGNVHLIGREDDQVKLHGIRFDLSDVEATADAFLPPGGKCIAVIAGQPDKTLVAFVHHPSCASETKSTHWALKLSPDTTPFLLDLRYQLETRLHDVMIPRYWIPISWIPQGNTGKVDRKLLQRWFEETAASDLDAVRSYATLANRSDPDDQIWEAELKAFDSHAIGMALRSAWQQTLGLADNRVSLHESFFHSGGDSISAIRFCSRVRAKGIQGCTVGQLYRTSSLSALLTALESVQEQSTEPESTGTVPQDHFAGYGLLASRDQSEGLKRDIQQAIANTPWQETRMESVWPIREIQRAMLLQSSSQNGRYVVQVMLTLTGTLDFQRLRTAWQILQEAHPSLRTTFIPVYRADTVEYFALILKPLTDYSHFHPQVLDLPSGNQFEEWLEADRHRGFAFGDLFHRLTVFQSSPETHHLVLTIHHAINDGWSLGIMWKDLSEAYGMGSLSARPSPAQFLAMDLARDAGSSLDYWISYLDGFEPFEVRPQALQSLQAAGEAAMNTKRLIVSITPEQISDCAQAHRVTGATILEAVTAIFLARVTGRSDLAFGITTSGRNAAVEGIDEMVGLFINTLPVRLNLDQHATLSSLLQHLAQDFASAIPHEHVALSQIVAKTPGSKSPFDTVLVYENFDTNHEQQFDETLALSEIDGREFSEFPFMIIVEHTSQGTQIVFKWTNNLLQVEEAEAWLSQFASLLSEVVQLPDGEQKLKRFGRGTDYREFEQVKTLYNAHRNYIRENPTEDTTLTALFTKSVAQHREKIALQSGTESLSFRELDERSNEVACGLLRANVCPGDVVPLVFSRCPDMIVAMLGVLKAGAAYCPLDPKAPSLRLQRLISKVQGRIVVLQRDILSPETVQSIRAMGLQVACIDTLTNKGAASTDSTALPGVSPDDRCYVLFTSGTTGEPKGCILSHRAVSNAVRETARIYNTGIGTRMLLFANYIFDASVIDIYGCLSSGAKLCFASEDDLRSDLNEVVARFSITSLHLTPSVLRFLDPDRCTTLQTLVSGGEKLPTSLRNTWAARLRLFDGYGPTEAAVQVSATPIVDPHDSPTIQQIIPGNFVLLLDQHGLVPRVGQVGEICIGGKQLFDGYIGEADLTARAITTMPGLDENLSLYRTGDLGLYTADMEIHIIGRKDSQVKISGQRIEVQEVENILVTAPGVLSAGVAVWRNQLIAVVQQKEWTEEVALSDATWQSFCEARLPAQLIPTHFLQGTVPLNTSQKVDRKQLAQVVASKMQDVSTAGCSSEQEAQTGAEAYILKVISDLLGTQVIDAEASFASIGLSSLPLMELRAIVSHHFSRELSFSELNSAGNARRLAARLDSASPITPSSESAPLHLVNDQVEALSTQRRMWLAQQRLQDETYNVCSLLTLKDASASRMAEAIRYVVHHIDAFRLTFTWNSHTNCLQQALKSELTVPVELVAMKDLTEIQEASRQYAQRCWDLENGPMAQFVVFDRGAEGIAIFYNIHHILVDEWTTQQMLETILDVYFNRSSGLKYGSTVEYAGLASQYGPGSSLYDKTMAGLLKHLDDVPSFDTSNWPTPPAGQATRESANIRHFVPSSEFEQFKRTCSGAGISWFSALLGLFQLLLHRYTSTQELGVLIPVSMRGALASSGDVFGNMVNTALLRSVREGEKTLRQFLEQTAASVNFAMDTVVVPFEDVLAQLKTTVSEHSVIFVAQEQGASVASKQIVDITRETFHARPVAFDLQLTLTSTKEGIVLDFQYDRSKFEASYMHEIAMGYAQLLQCAFSLCDTPVKHIDLCTPEQRQMMEAFANFPTVKPPCRDALLHELFEETATRQPGSIAVDHWDGEQHTLTTYQELDAKAATLARLLQAEYGVRVGDIVPVFVDQGTIYVISVLAVLKTGATFTPMAQDGTWPANRVTGIVTECSSKVVIADIETPENLPCPTLQIHSVDFSGKGETAPIVCEATPDTISYILWTSGTTGAPKGVMIPHSSAVTYFREAAACLYQGTAADRTFQFASPVFDASMEDLFHTFVEGGTLCTAPRQLLLSDLHNVFRALHPTVADLTPTVISLLEPFLGSFRVLVTAGEPQNEKVRADWTKSSTRLINACGPAENTVISYFGPVTPTSNIRSIGRPVASVVTLILDAFGKVCPRHALGTLWLGGSQLFTAYLNQPELTARVFINHPRYGRLYNSGDVAYYDSEGQIIHCGRGDDQVKIRGQRLELSGINSMIEECDFVRRALVMKDKEKLIAFVVWADEPERPVTELLAETLNPDEHSKLKALRESMKAKASSAMIPSIWIQVNKVPLRQSGKADHKLLRSLITHQETSEDESGKPPVTPVEHVLHDACCRTLGLRAVGMERNVFELGMDSFLVMRFLSETRKHLPKCRLTLRHVAEAPTLEGLAAGIEVPDVDHQALVCLELPAVSRFDRESTALVPASSVQTRFYWAQALLADATYNVPSLYKLDGLLPGRVESVMASILNEHAIFRTTFVSDGDALRQKLHTTSQVEVRQCDLASLDGNDATHAMRDMCIKDAATVFDLKKGPLGRVILFLLPGESSFLFLNFHHIIIDEQSMRQLVHEVARRAGQIEATPVVTPTGGPQYADFAEQEQKLLQNPDMQAESKSFWQEYLSNFTPVNIPPFHLGSGKPQRAMCHYDFTLPQDSLSWVRKQGLTNFSAFLSLYMILLHRVWNLADATVTIPASQRADQGSTEMYGCFINTVPVRAQLSGNRRLGPFLKSMSRDLFRVLHKSYLPYDQILDAAKIGTDNLPLMFIYHEASKDVCDGLVDAHHLLRETNSETSGQSKFPVTFSMTLGEQKEVWNVTLNVEYDMSMIQRKSVDQLCEHFASLLRAVSQSADDISIGHLDILTPQEKELVQIQQRNISAVHREKLAPRFVHQLVRDQAAQFPDQIACDFEGKETVTYRELWNKVEHISAGLISFRQGVDNKVGIFMDAGIDRIASILAVLNCGMAWVPLEVSLPVARLVTIVEDCQPQVILTTQTLGSDHNTVLQELHNATAHQVPLYRLPSAAPTTEAPTVVVADHLQQSDLAYILYTSGSTGKPKGVQVEHLPLLNAILAFRSLYECGRDSRFLQFVPWTFDISIMDVFASLTTGATLCLGGKDFLLSNFNSIFSRMQITHILASPTMMSLLTPEEAPTLKVLSSGAEAMTAKVRDVWADRVTVFNAFGPTEACIYNLVSRVRRDLEPNNIGMPTPGNTAFIVNEELGLCPVGTIGQLAIGGVQLSRGYLNRPEANRAFVNHPLLGRIYLTGDYAIRNHDQSITYLGRMDTQTKIHGQRVELEEISNTALAHPAMHNTLAMVVDRASTSHLALIFEPSGRGGSTVRQTEMQALDARDFQGIISEVHSNLLSILPHYAVPSLFIPISFMAMNANQKTDRKRAAALVADLSDTQLLSYSVEAQEKAANLPLETEQEFLIADTMRQVLKVREIFANSNFFAMGGTSISAIRLCSILRRSGFTLIVNHVYAHPTVAELAANVRYKSPVTMASDNKLASWGNIHPIPIMDWFIDQQKINPNWNNQAHLLRMARSVTFTDTEQAWQRITEIHPSLRIRCSSSTRAPPRLYIPIQSSSRDYAIIRRAVPSEKAMELMIPQVQASLDITKGPVSALAWIETPSTTYCLIVIHHLAIDIVSWQIIFDDLEQILAGESVLPEGSSFRRWSLQVRERQKSALPRGLDTTANCSGSEQHENHRIVPAFASHRHRNVQSTVAIIETSLAADLTQLCLTDANKTHRTEPVELLLAGLTLALYRWRQIRRVELTLESHGRELQNEALDLSRTVGWFTYLYPAVFAIPLPSISGSSRRREIDSDSDSDGTTRGSYTTHDSDSDSDSNSGCSSRSSSSSSIPRDDKTGVVIPALVSLTKATRRTASQGTDFAVSNQSGAGDHPVLMFNYAGTYHSGNTGDGQLFDAVTLPSVETSMEDPRNVRPSVLDFNCGAKDGVMSLSILYSQAMHAEEDVQALLTFWKEGVEEIVKECVGY